jgi:hypothetical protein
MIAGYCIFGFLKEFVANRTFWRHSHLLLDRKYPVGPISLDRRTKTIKRTPTSFSPERTVNSESTIHAYPTYLPFFFFFSEIHIPGYQDPNSQSNPSKKSCWGAPTVLFKAWKSIQLPRSWGLGFCDLQQKNWNNTVSKYDWSIWFF